MCTPTCNSLWPRVPHMLPCLHVVCVKDFTWACALLHIHQQACLLSVCKRWSVFFPLNHWWDCNSNTGPPVSSPTVCRRLASSQCRLQENQYAALTEHRQQTWKLEKKTTISYKIEKAPQKQTVTVTFRLFQFYVHMNDQTEMKGTVTRLAAHHATLPHFYSRSY